MFTENGVKIYHVDSRVGKITATYNSRYGEYEYDYEGYLENPTYNQLVSNTNGDTYVDIYASNTPSWSCDKNFKKLTLLSSAQNSKKGYYYSNTNAKNSDLYQTGDSVTSYTFNSGSSLLFKISIESIGDTGATIKFS